MRGFLPRAEQMPPPPFRRPGLPLRAIGEGSAAHSSVQSSSFAATPPPPSSEMPEPSTKVKRAKSAQKITRRRRITSCLQCREKKAKCDRQRPMCGQCIVGNSRGGMCTYVDHADGGPRDGDDVDGEADVAPDGKRPKRDVERSPPPLMTMNARPMLLPAQSPLTVRRLNLITATAKAGRDRSLDFESRIRYARAAAVGTILFGTPATIPQPYQPLAAVDSLKLPTAAEIGPYLDTYRRNVEWMCNVVIVDLNRARFESFLNWWHSHPQTLPADPPLIPLVLTILALALQARRMAPYCTLRHRKHARAHSPKQAFEDSISSEKELLETAQRCIDVLQIACPSNWASAFSAPLDLVRASLLRGMWHMTELHLQFAGSCFATTVRLAHAASLHQDARHWPKMGPEEAQARRNIFWNVAQMELMFSMRVVQPSVILASGLDTRFPDDYEALLNLYRFSGLIEPYIVEGRRSHFRVPAVSKPSFDFHLARFKLTSVLIHGQESLKTGLNFKVAEEHEEWKQGLTKEIRHYLESTDESDETHYLQACALQMMSFSTSIQIHRPRVDGHGQWQAPEGQAQRSLEVCIQSAQRLIWLIFGIVTRDPGPPYVFYHLCIFHCFQAAIILAILVTFDRSSAFAITARPSIQTALQTLDMIAEQEGLRNVAEQAGKYAATLREVDEKQQARLLGRLEKDNVHRSGVGVPALALAEGDGKMLGGQGYPTSDQTATPMTNVRTLSHAAGLPELQSNAFHAGDLPPIQSIQRTLSTAPHLHSNGIDFSDLQVFGTTDTGMASGNGGAAMVDGPYADRPFEGAPHRINGLSDTAPPQQAWPSQSRSGEYYKRPGEFDPVRASPVFEAQTASVPALASLGESFAMDWNEWERAVERLLYSER